MTKPADKPLAIIGMGCWLPGAEGLDAYWDMLVNGRSGIDELPPHRLNRDLYYHPEKGRRARTYTTRGGCTSDRPFDRDSCPISDELLARAHRVHLKLCEVTSQACRHAQLDPFTLSGQNAGVYIGHTPPTLLCSENVYARLVEHTAQYLRQVDGIDPLLGRELESVIAEVVADGRKLYQDEPQRIHIDAKASDACALISRTFGFTGPSMALDAACASSLRALGHAARALQFGHIDMAVVGGASVCNTNALVLFSAAQSVSATGSRPFDNDADGLAASEGYVIVLMKTLEKARSDGDPIHAVVQGVGISSDGKGKSLWAPRKEGQVAAMRRAYSETVPPGSLQYIEAHATSTEVGDATELSALAEVYRDAFPNRRLPLGSAKANIGHTLETAGLTSLVKTVLAMQHGIVPPQIHVRELNQKVDWDNAPFYVPTEAVSWPEPDDGSPRRAAVNAFGIGGLNVHLVLDQGRELAASTPLSQPETDRPTLEPVAIVGRGAITPGARTINELWNLFQSGEDQRREITPDRWDVHLGFDHGQPTPWRVSTKLGAMITDFEYDWKKHKIPPKQIAAADPLQFMLLDAVDQALQDAGFQDLSFDRSRTGVIVGTVFGDEFSQHLEMGIHLPRFQHDLERSLKQRGVADDAITSVCEQFEEILLDHMPALIDETGSFTASTLASRITKTYDFMGGAVAIDAGEASSLAALSSSLDLLRAGDCDLMICAAGHRSLGFAQYESYFRDGDLAGAIARAPFDAENSGRVPGEGVGVVILKRLSDAQRDGDRIHGIVHGVAASCHESPGQSVRSAIERCDSIDGVDLSQVSLIETGSSGTPRLDREEITAIAAAYSDRRSAPPLQLGTISGQLGDTSGAAGLLAILKAVDEMDRLEITPNVNLHSPAEYLSEQSHVLQLPTSRGILPVTTDDGTVLSAINCLSHYHLAYHAIIERPTKVHVAEARPTPSPATTTATPVLASRHDWRIVRLGAETLDALAPAVANAIPQTLYTSAQESVFHPAERARLAIVTNSIEDLTEKLKLAHSQLHRPTSHGALAERGISIGQVKNSPPMVAFLFPGQGSQYTGMLKSLIETFPPAAETLRQIDEVLARLKLPSFAELAWEEDNGLGQDIWRTQLSLLIADTIVFAATRAMGLNADRITGHSFGELAALTAAGSWSFEDAILATSARCRSMDACRGEKGTLLSTSAPAELLEEFCQATAGQVSISHYNTPDQTVVGGEQDAIQRLAKRVEQAGYLSVPLDVPAAFHTPLLTGVKEPFRDALSRIRMEPPRIPLLSSVTNRYTADPDEIRENLVEQMTRPVNWISLAQRLYDDGVTMGIEVGPRTVLTSLTRRVLDGKNITLVPCDHPRRHGLQQLLTARAAIEVTGGLDPQKTRIIVRDNVTPGPQSQIDRATDTSRETPGDQPEIEDHGPLNIVRLSGTPYDMGWQQGQVHQASLRRILHRYADLAGTRWDWILRPDETTTHQHFGPHECEELRGIADGAGVSLESLIAHNLRLFQDNGGGGIHLALSAQSDQVASLLHASNEDLRIGLSVSDCLERQIQVRHPHNGFAHLALTVAGQVGTLNGINSKGVAVSAAAILDCPAHLTETEGPLQTVRVKNVLEGADTVQQAIEICRHSPGDSAWSLILSHHPTDDICHLEYDGSSLKVDTPRSQISASNHRLNEGNTNTSSHSLNRLARLQQLLDNDDGQMITPERLQKALRDRFDPKRGQQLPTSSLNTVRRIDNQVSIVMQPAMGRIWVTPGNVIPEQQDHFTEINIKALLAGPATLEPHKETPVPQHAGPLSGGPDPQPSPPAGTKDASVRDLAPFLIAPEDYEESLESIRNRSTDLEQDQTCHRFVVRLMPTPGPTPVNEARLLAGTTLILGQNPVADALQRRIQSLGGDCHLIEPSSHMDGVVSHIERLWQAGPIRQLLITTPHDNNACQTDDATAWQERRQQGVLNTFLACQRWFQLVVENNLVHQATLAGVVALGGDFGLSGQVDSRESGFVTGFIKNMFVEVSLQDSDGFRTCVVDSPHHQGDLAAAETIADRLLREITADAPDIEVGYVNGKRHLTRPVFQPIHGETAETDRPTGAWVVTGGARGITAEAARELARRYGIRLHLVGSTPQREIPATWHHLSEKELQELKQTVVKESLANGEKPIEAWAQYEKAIAIDSTLRSMSDEGIQASYYSCDVADRASLAAVLDKIRTVDGPIEGVLHGAGFERAGKFEKKKPEFVERTLAAKLDGAAWLMEFTKHDPLKHFIGYGSVSGRFGGLGLSDYAAASDMLGKMIDRFRHERPSCQATCFYWHLWDGVGMAVRPETRTFLERMGFDFMPLSEGLQHLVDEIEAGLPEPETVITDWQLYGLHCLGEAPGAASVVPKTGDDPAKTVTQVTTDREPGEVETRNDIDECQDVAQRYVVEMVEKPLPPDTPDMPTFHGAAVILGENEDATALMNRLRSLDVTVHSLPIGDTPDVSLEALEALWQQEPAPHLFILTAREPAANDFASSTQWQARRHRGVMLPFLVCQKWMQLLAETPRPVAAVAETRGEARTLSQPVEKESPEEANMLSRATLLGVTALGGDFGLTQPAEIPEGGSITGLLKGIHGEVVTRQLRTFRSRIVDASVDEASPALIDRILRELAADETEIEIASREGQRLVPRIRRESVTELTRKDIPHGGTWVLTGGARGITAQIAMELGRRFNLKLHLLGRSRLPEIDPAWHDYTDEQMQELKVGVARQALAEGQSATRAWEQTRTAIEIDRNLRAFRNAGLNVHYHSCDVSVRSALTSTLETIRTQHGPIEGIIHGAGINHGARFETKRAEQVDQMFQPKLDGLLNLMELTTNDPIQYFIGFASVSSRFGANGLVDYCQSNDMLCKILGWYRGQRPDCHCTSFHWASWGDVGMMMNPYSFGSRSVNKLRLMPATEGVRHLVEELRAGTPRSEIVISDDEYFLQYHSPEILLQDSAHPSKPITNLDTLPLVDAIVANSPGHLVTTLQLDPTSDPFLLEHRMKGHPCLPMVAAIDAIAESASLLDERFPIAMRNIKADNALRFFNDRPQSVNVTLEDDGERVRARLTADFCNRAGRLVDADREYARCEIVLGDDVVSDQAPTLPPPEQWSLFRYADDAPMTHGEIFRGLQEIALDQDSGWGRLLAIPTAQMQGRREGEQWFVHPTLLDSCFYLCGVFAWQIDEGAAHVPEGIGQLRSFCLPRDNERCYVQIIRTSQDGPRSSFDCTCIGDDGRVLFRVNDYQSVEIPGSR